MYISNKRRTIDRPLKTRVYNPFNFPIFLKTANPRAVAVGNCPGIRKWPAASLMKLEIPTSRHPVNNIKQINNKYLVAQK